MRYIKKELIDAIKDSGHTTEDIEAMVIYYEPYGGPSKRKLFKEVDEIPDDLQYDAGYGTQELFGAVLFTDKTWLERREYDGSEWWEFLRPPTHEDLWDLYNNYKGYML